eukprot:SAG31_NODE_130_length_23424_cov_45.648802_11_plen_92_part_00
MARMGHGGMAHGRGMPPTMDHGPCTMVGAMPPWAMPPWVGLHIRKLIGKYGKYWHGGMAHAPWRMGRAVSCCSGLSVIRYYYRDVPLAMGG